MRDRHMISPEEWLRYVRDFGDDLLARIATAEAKLATAERERDKVDGQLAAARLALKLRDEYLQRAREALMGLIAVMELQEGRADGSYHLSAKAFRPLWDKAKKAALDVLPEPHAALTAESPAPYGLVEPPCKCGEADCPMCMTAHPVEPAGAVTRNSVCYWGYPNGCVGPLRCSSCEAFDNCAPNHDTTKG